MSAKLVYLSSGNKWVRDLNGSNYGSQIDLVAAQRSKELSRIYAIIQEDAVIPSSVYIHGHEFRFASVCSPDVYYFKDAHDIVITDLENDLMAEYSWAAAKALAESLLNDEEQLSYGVNVRVVWVYKHGQSEAIARLDEYGWQMESQLA